VDRINNGEEFADLRTVYVGLAIAQWYKGLNRNEIPFGDIIDTKNIDGIEYQPYDQAYWGGLDIMEV
jgi:hypothetical protein